MISATEYRSSYDKAMAELRDLVEERARLVERMESLECRRANLCAGLKALAMLCGLPVDPLVEQQRPASFTNLVRNVLRAANEPIYATTVRARLLEDGIDINAYHQPLALIHVILKRLVKQGEAERSDNLYCWKNDKRT